MSGASAQLETERAILIGAFLATFTYGIHLTLFIWCFLTLLRKRSIQNRLFLLVFITLLVVFGSIGHGANVKLIVAMFIDKPNIPPLEVEASLRLVIVLGNSANFVNSWLQDGLLLYRFWVFWHSGWFILVIPSLMYPASFVLSLMLIVEQLKPGILIWSKISVNLGVPYWSISIALNILITLSIAGRLMLIRYQQRNISGLSNINYLSISAMLVESAALYTTVGLVFLVSYASNSVVQHYTLAALAQVQCISPLLIILRAVQGKAWSRRRVDSLATRHVESDVQFVNNGSSTVIDNPKKVGSEPKPHRISDGGSDPHRNGVTD
ncbi:hypothetical protein BYT27DRAFT_7082399 [Phlegmacium glaucopus]|nr:hypothetical protein BYT27DRAFT_7082399 [Phlegmacium glaucopus]